MLVTSVGGDMSDILGITQVGAAVPSLFGSSDQLLGRLFFLGWGGGETEGRTQAVMGGKLHLLTCHSPPAVRPSPNHGQGLGTPLLVVFLNFVFKV